jgi:uncharacterized protein (DUF486 family)
MIKTNASGELIKITETYNKYLPINTFPWIMLSMASIVQFFAWFGGRYLFPKSTLLNRVILLWLIAGIEFLILIPGIGASAEILGYSESFLAIIFHAFQLVIFYIINRFTLKAEFTKKHYIAFILMILSVIIASQNKF